MLLRGGVSNRRQCRRAGTYAACGVRERVDASTVNQRVGYIEDLYLIRRSARYRGPGDVIVAQVGIHHGRCPNAVLQILHTVNAIRQMGDGDCRPVRACAIQESDVDISGVIGRRFEIPVKLAIIPVVRINCSSCNPVDRIVIERGLRLVKVIGIVAAP